MSPDNGARYLSTMPVYIIERCRHPQIVQYEHRSWEPVAVHFDHRWRDELQTLQFAAGVAFADDEYRCAEYARIGVRR